MPPLTIPAAVARRFVLGRHGLWPGRRWSGISGLRNALHAVGHLQLDPLNITARSQDIMLHARVAHYEPEQWEQLAYGKREYFDWGAWLALRPIAHLPHYRALMANVPADPRYQSWVAAHPGVLDEMREVVRAEGPVSNRDFHAANRRAVTHYRGRKDSSVALYHLWRSGELMIHSRNRFERAYDLAERIAPASLLTATPLHSAMRFLTVQQVAFWGIRGAAGGFPAPGPRTGAEAAPLLTELVHDGTLSEIRVEHWRGPQYVQTSELPLLHAVLQGEVPAAWQPLGPTTTEQVTLLAPLDPVAARGRAKQLFGFDYVWEVYKPAKQRRWGYYVLPILWGDTLVARADMRLQREHGTLEVLGFWVEDPALVTNLEFADALGRGLGAFQQFLGATSVAAPTLPRGAFRRAVQAHFG